MAKSMKKRSTGRKAPSRISKKAPTKRKSTCPVRAHSETKQSRAIAMLQSDAGATIPGLMEATGWQQHSVRGFLAGVIRKRLKLKLESSKVEGCRIYRIVGSGGAEQASSGMRGS
jgi:hypothetical protein